MTEMTAPSRTYDPVRFHRGSRGFAAVVGMIRGRAWSGALVGYLAAAGIAVAAFGVVAAATGLDIVGPDRGAAVGFLLWMIGSWLVATRFALKPFTYTRPAPQQARRVVARPVPDARPTTGPRKRRRPAPATTRPARPLPTPRIIQPVPRGVVLYPISTPTA